MRVDLFSIGKFTVHSYGLLIAVGVVLAVIMAMRRGGEKGSVRRGCPEYGGLSL